MKTKKAMSLTLAALLSVSISTTAKAKPNKLKALMDNMTLEQKITQMLMPDFRQWRTAEQTSVTDMTELNEEVAAIIDKYDFGGVILFANNVKETKQTLKLTYDIQKTAMDNKAGNGNIPLLITIDQEGGIVYRLGSGTALPGNMALGATRSTAYAEAAGKVIGSELQALGINVNFAPVFDTNNNPLNPVIGLRSYSSNPELVGELGVAQMKGMQEYNIATAAKHFPGHGDTATDSHTGLPLVDKSYEELASLELVPFQAAVDNGVDMLMTAHIAYPQIEKDMTISKSDGSEIYIPATLSDDIITGIVRNKMNYDGIVVTDALNMDAISKNFGEAEAVIMAIEAGVDILLMPTILRSEEDLQKLDNIIAKVKLAVKEGRITMDNIDDSVERILKLKEKRGILDLSKDIRTFEERLIEAKSIVGSQENRAVEREIAEAAVTIIKNEEDVLPLKPEAGDKVLLLAAYDSEKPGMELGMRRLIAEGKIPDSVAYETYTYNSKTTLEELKSKIDSASYVVVISEIGSAAQLLPTHWLTRVPTEVVDYANSQSIPTVVMSISKPYDVANYPEAKAIAAVYGNKGMDPTENLQPDKAFGPNIPAGIEVIFGGKSATGKLPVDVPVIENGVMDTSRIAYPFGHGLVYEKEDKIDVSQLEAFYNEVKDTAMSKYIKVGQSGFKAALKDAGKVLKSPSSQEAVDNALGALKEAYGKLQVKHNKK